MNLLVSLLALGLSAVYFFYPEQIPVEFSAYAPMAITALISLVFLLGLVGLVTGSGKKETGHAVESEKKDVKETTVPVPSLDMAIEAEVIQLLAKLQDKGRLMDFIMDDITPYSNEQVGAAARVVHQGCKEVIQNYFDIQPVHSGAEQEEISLAEDFDANAYRLVGNVPENPPFNGTVLHRGWKTITMTLPRLTNEAKESTAREIIAPAEIEIT